jgi:hypothetical protein
MEKTKSQESCETVPLTSGIVTVLIHTLLSINRKLKYNVPSCGLLKQQELFAVGLGQCTLNTRALVSNSRQYQVQKTITTCLCGTKNQIIPVSNIVTVRV